jgi:hypothetical protein
LEDLHRLPNHTCNVQCQGNKNETCGSNQDDTFSIYAKKSLRLLIEPKTDEPSPKHHLRSDLSLETITPSQLLINSTKPVTQTASSLLNITQFRNKTHQTYILCDLNDSKKCLMFPISITNEKVIIKNLNETILNILLILILLIVSLFLTFFYYKKIKKFVLKLFQNLISFKQKLFKLNRSSNSERVRDSDGDSDSKVLLSETNNYLNDNEIVNDNTNVYQSIPIYNDDNDDYYDNNGIASENSSSTTIPFTNSNSKSNLKKQSSRPVPTLHSHSLYLKSSSSSNQMKNHYQLSSTPKIKIKRKNGSNFVNKN